MSDTPRTDDLAERVRGVCPHHDWECLSRDIESQYTDMRAQLDKSILDHYNQLTITRELRTENADLRSQLLACQSAIAVKDEALKYNHEWHEAHDEYDGYYGSSVHEINITALATTVDTSGIERVRELLTAALTETLKEWYDKETVKATQVKIEEALAILNGTKP